MKRELKSIARWLTMFLIVVGLLGVIPTAMAAQSEATPGALTEEQTDPPAQDEPVVVPTDVPSDPSVEEEPVVVPTEIPADPSVEEDPVVVPTELPEEQPTEEAPVVDPTVESAEPAGDEESVEPVASPGAPSLGIQAIDGLQENGSIIATAVDEGGDDILNVCFTVFENNGGSQGQFLGQGCDSNDGSDGATTITGIPAGTHIVVASYVDPGFVVGSSQLVTIDPGETTSVTFEIASGGRTIRIAKVDDASDPLPGACFNVTEDSGNGQPGDFVGGNCSDPSRTDGLVFIFGVAPGEYVLVETTAPSGFVAGPPLAFTVTAGSGNFNLTIVNSPIDSPGNLIVNKVDENGDPLAGARSRPPC